MGGSDTRATLPVRHRVSRRDASGPPAPRLPEVAQRQRHELGVRHRVAAHEAAGLLGQAESPFEAHALQQTWGAACHAGDDVDRAADAHGERDAELWAPAADEVLLARR